MLLVISCILHSHFSSMKKGAGSLDGVKFEKFFNRVLSQFNTKARRKVGHDDPPRRSCLLVSRVVFVTLEDD